MNRCITIVSLISLVIGFSAIVLFPSFSDVQSSRKAFVIYSESIVQTSGTIIDPL